MSAPPPVKFAVRTKFALTSTRKAVAIIRREKDLTLKPFEQDDLSLCAKQVKVPRMLGVDEDMRNWSFYMILEHNIIVNQRIRLAVMALKTGVPLDDGFDIKKDVMPARKASGDTPVRFVESVDRFLDCLPRSPDRRDPNQSPHPLFGDLNIHGWICMFGFHLKIHRRQAEVLRGLVS